jgi:hypothetical protein
VAEWDQDTKPYMAQTLFPLLTSAPQKRLVVVGEGWAAARTKAIHRIVGATDPGHAVNPAQIDRQVAGSFVYGLSALFYWAVIL